MRLTLKLSLPCGLRRSARCCKSPFSEVEALFRAGTISKTRWKKYKRARERKLDREWRGLLKLEEQEKREKQLLEEAQLHLAEMEATTRVH